MIVGCLPRDRERVREHGYNDHIHHMGVDDVIGEYVLLNDIF